ncbi:MAG TPA: endolytic transglycosylase MltG, partial [Solirubrobacteraceae bacterium]|nr:endolytic transglycosylase MltG [Solirubrobacteraceae bacterium]
MSDRTPEEREAARREREARRGPLPAQGPAPVVRPPESPEPQGPQGHQEPREPLEPPTLDPPDHPPSFAAPPLPVGRPPRRRRAVRAPGERSGASRGRSTAARIVAVAVLVLAIVAIWFLDQLFQPFAGSGHGSVVITVPSGASTGSIGDELARDGVISSSFFFGLRATLEGDRGKLRAGTYHLKRGMSYGAALSVLSTAPPAAPTTDVTIIPGRTRREIALLLHQQGVHGRFLTDTEHTTLLNLRGYGAPRHLSNLEGFLFPSTYQVRTPISIPALVNDQLTTFRQQFATVDMSYARRKNLTPYDVLTIASMVEAEAGTAHDRPLIASVIYNRLAQGMTL